MPRGKRIDKKSKETRTRPPVVTIMGHVDHGKTTLLDAIRESKITDSEFGGITQHINAYKIDYQGRGITFVDTPGHEAFMEMRVRGGKVADIVILVVAASEGVKPQTKESISLAKKAGVPIIVAINKIDLKTADVDKVKRDLNSEGLLLEAFGGDTVSVEVSAKEKKNLDSLLEMILLVSDLLDLKDTSAQELKAVVIESRMDQKKGPVGVLIVKEGRLEIGDQLFVEGKPFKVKYLADDGGKSVAQAHPSDPVLVLGFKEVPSVGTVVSGSADGSLGKGDASTSATKKTLIDTLDAEQKILNIILKADTNGTLDAISSSLSKVRVEDSRAQILYAGVGEVNESDIQLAETTSAIVLAFNVKTQPAAKYLSKYKGIEINEYNIIYELISDVEEALSGILSFEESQIKGRAKVKKVFKLPSGDLVAGVEVLVGRLKVSNRVVINPEELDEEEEPVYRGTIKNLKQGRDIVKNVEKDSEGGVFLKPQYSEIKKGDIIEVL